jgi:hypothetical protein
MACTILRMFAVFVRCEKVRSILSLSNCPKEKNGFLIFVILILHGKKLVTHYFVFYNQKRNICLLPTEINVHLGLVLRVLTNKLSPQTILWVAIEIKNPNFTSIVEKFVYHGFGSPHITNQSPAKNTIATSLALFKEIRAKKYNISFIFSKVLYAMEERKRNGFCLLKVKFSKHSIDFLRQCSLKGITINKNGQKIQKELTGELIIKKIIRKNNTIIHLIDVNLGSVESGDEEDVNVESSRYNFHSHPKQAYINHSVDKAWPSCTDYLGYLKLGKNTIFHSVATLEGLYVMSFSPYWGQRLKKVSKNFVEQNYNIDREQKITPLQYVKKINSILFRGYPIYNVQFFPWEKAGKIFSVYYSKIGSSCLPMQSEFKNYKKLYKFQT